MPSYYVDTGRYHQERIDGCHSPADAIREFCKRLYRGDLEECSDSSYKGWAKVTFYVSPPYWECANPKCDELIEEEGAFCGGCTFICDACGLELDDAERAATQDEDDYICKTCNTPLYQLARAGEDD